MRAVVKLLLITMGLLMAYAGTGLPEFGDPKAPAAQHVSNRYIQNAYHDAKTPNIVTVMIADYRSFDTFGETVVVFTAGLAVFFLLHVVRRTETTGIAELVARDPGMIIGVSTRIVVPIVQIFAFYVVFHGHYSPGGGFQGGALLAASILMQRVVFGRERSQRGFPSWLALPFGMIGVALFLATGLVSMLSGGEFLAYDAVPLQVDRPALLRNAGILLVEVGVAFAVMGILVSIFDDLTGQKRLADPALTATPREEQG